MKTIQRKDDIRTIKELLEIFPVVTILGSRQCGKTTLAKQFPFNHYFDLENPRDIARLKQPQIIFESIKGLIIIDEIQRSPDLFPLLRYIVDNQHDKKFLILGSASPSLVKHSSETMAGRIGYHYLGGLSPFDVGFNQYPELWLRGAYPKSFLAKSLKKSRIWRQNFIKSFLERDIPQLGIHIPEQTLRRFWTMLSHYHGQIINYSEIGRSFGMSDNTIRKYIDVLTGTFVVRTLQPWYVNIGKRLVKRPKIYFRDSGIFHTFASIRNINDLQCHPKLGASWEGFALENVSRIIESEVTDIYFWRTHRGAEVDLFWQWSSRNWAIEFKYMDAPRLTKSMKSALNDLELEHLWIIYPGKERYPIDKKITALPFTDISKSEFFK
ncbi:MAG TPA: ATP-binding protein [Bacteroidetes bacterium]|nr:ATP-binding protein [Bacteroidota bacterium]